MGGPIRLYMSMSLDGFIAGPDDRPGQELGRRGGRLFNWLDDRESDGPSGQVYREALATGAVISGRRTFELAGRWQGDTTTAYRSSSSPTGWTTGTCRRGRRVSSPTSRTAPVRLARRRGPGR